MRDTFERIVSRDEIVDLLKSTLQFKPVCQKILYSRIIEQHASLQGLTIAEGDIQAEVDDFRRQMSLEKASDTFSWLDNEGIQPSDWEAGIRDRLLAENLKKLLFEKEIEKTFYQGRINFEKVSLYRLVVSDEQLAQELFYQIEDREISFYEAAHLYDVDEDRRDRCGYEGIVPRSALQAVLAAAVFGANAGELIAPVGTDEGYHLLLPQRFVQAELTEEIREQILDQLFQEWLTRESSHYVNNQAEVKLD